MTETKVRPVSMKQSIYQDMDDGQWYWTLPSSEHPVKFSRPVGPFRTREAARQDFRHVMGLDNDNNFK